MYTAVSESRRKVAVITANTEFFVMYPIKTAIHNVMAKNAKSEVIAAVDIPSAIIDER